jgi:uncharacterized damage-inducible protein DinB
VSVGLSFENLMDYTEWERGLWEEWFTKLGDQVLEIKTGPNADGRFQTIGDVIRHVFSVEVKILDRLKNRPMTDVALVPSNSVAALFQFGKQGRKELREFVQTVSAQDWDEPQEFKAFKMVVRGTRRKFVAQALIHEIRHWAQIATMMRLNGLKVEWHDFLFSPVLGGGVERDAN